MSRGFAELLEEAQQAPFAGWDFSFLDGRVRTEPLPWSYSEMVLDVAARSGDLLDLGTGGGEWLRGLPRRPPRTIATEAWPPNVGVADAHLRPIGVAVVAVEGAPDNPGAREPPITGRLPFRSGGFGLVVDRHEAFNAREVMRVLAPGGVFVTQQVDTTSDRDWYPLLGLVVPDEPYESWLDQAVEQLESAGLRVDEAQRGEQVDHYLDVGAIAWYLKSIGFVVPGFTIEGYRDRLAELHDQLALGADIAIRQPRFVVTARRLV